MDKPMTFNEWLGTQGNLALVHANCCRIAYEAGQQSQQAKVEELQTHAQEIHKREIKLFEKTLILTHERDELQKRVDAATRKWVAVTSIATTCPNQLPDEFFQKLDELHDALCGVGLEQALKGEGQ